MELGLSNDIKAQQVPRRHCNDEAAAHDLDGAQLTAMVRFTAQLPAPIRDVPASMTAKCAEGEASLTTSAAPAATRPISAA